MATWNSRQVTQPSLMFLLHFVCDLKPDMTTCVFCVPLSANIVRDPFGALPRHRSFLYRVWQKLLKLRGRVNSPPAAKDGQNAESRNPGTEFMSHPV